MGVMLVVMTTLLVLFLPSESGSAPGSPTELVVPSTITGQLRRVLPGRGSLALREDFRTDLRDWQTSLGSLSSNWQKIGDSVQVGEMRFWRPTLTLRDYNVEFGARVEQRAVSWAFRASDSRNYYATKLALTRTGEDITRAEIIRYAVVNGQQTSRVRLPIPLSAVMGRRNDHEIKLGVRGSQFTTTINGQSVDSWADNRLRRGGLGFFSEPGEKAALRWVAVTERENLISRFLSFGMVLPPEFPAADFPIE